MARIVRPGRAPNTAASRPHFRASHRDGGPTVRSMRPLPAPPPRRRAALFALLAATLLAGCGTPAEPDGMRLAEIERMQLRGWLPESLRGQVVLGTVEGGVPTARYWGSRLGNEALRVALDELLRGTGLMSLQPDGGRYELRLKVLGQAQPWISVLDANVTVYVEYRLVERASGQLVYQRQMRLHHVTPWSDAMLDPNERIRLANEGALRHSFSELMRELVAAPQLRG